MAAGFYQKSADNEETEFAGTHRAPEVKTDLMAEKTEKLLVKSDIDRSDSWPDAFRDFDIELIDWQEFADPDDIDYALVWEPPPGFLAQFVNLKIIFSIGAGIDHLKGENILPANVPVVRMVEEGLTAGMVEYVVYQTLHFHRHMPQYEQDRKYRRWHEIIQAPARERTVGILGLGVLGQAAAEFLLALGFNVIGWSRTEKTVAGVRSYFGDDQLGAMLSMSDILVCLLPGTDQTRGILNADNLGKLPRGAYLINAGRGACQVEADIIAALDEGQLAGAALDVFEVEPLPETSPIWDHPKIHFTPHVASMTLPESSAAHVYNNIERFRNNLPLTHVADMERGY